MPKTPSFRAFLISPVQFDVRLEKINRIRSYHMIHSKQQVIYHLEILWKTLVHSVQLVSQMKVSINTVENRLIDLVMHLHSLIRFQHL